MYLGHDKDGEQVVIPASDLLTHGVILGRTGSGKSGLTVALVEEAVAEGSSVIVFDPKGDLTNLALSLASKKDFEDWAEGDSDEAYLKHGDGLAEFGLGFEHVKMYRNWNNVTVYAPGKTAGGGKQINVFPGFEVPKVHNNTVKQRAARDVTAVLQAVGLNTSAIDPAVVYLTEAVRWSWANGLALPITKWPGVLTSPPDVLKSFGGMKLEDFFPKRERTKLARAVIGFQHQADKWLTGPSLDIGWMADIADRPQIAVLSMRHLSESDRLFFAGLMMNKIVEYMYETQASKALKLTVVLDEARGYLPPYPANPPTKAPICTLLAQGRAQGIGMVIGTQNPMDLDYKALSNVGSWFIGRLRERDCARDLLSELNDRGIDIEDVTDMPQRKFLFLDKRGGNSLLNVRWCYNHLRGPMSGPELQRLDDWAPSVDVVAFEVNKEEDEVIDGIWEVNDYD